MIKVVLDTNVIVSAHLKGTGSEAGILQLTFADSVALYVSKPILTEYAALLRRAKFSFYPKLIDQSLDRLQQIGIMTAPSHKLSISSDEPDNRFLECAEAAGADYLVTGNKRHFPKAWKQTRVVNARELLEIIASELKR